MGLFSFFSKNKQGRTADDSGRFYSKDDDAAIGERARAKRPSNAGAAAAGRRSGNDPMLPEKKRARRRLVGAIALALAAAVGLPMLLDSEPKPPAGDIAIQIPSKDKAAPLPVPGAAEPEQQGAADKAVAAEDSVGQDEEIIDAPPAAAAKPGESRPAVAKLKPEPKPEAVKPEHKEARPDTRVAERAERERAERAERERTERAERERAERLARAERERSDRAERAERERAEKAERLERLRAEEKARAKAEDKPVKPVPSAAQSEARALAILQGKPVDKEKDKPADAGGPKVTLQVAAMSSQEKAAEVQARLRSAGISSHTEKFGELIRVKIGPLSKDEADRVRAKLGKLGL